MTVPLVESGRARVLKVYIATVRYKDVLSDNSLSKLLGEWPLKFHYRDWGYATARRRSPWRVQLGLQYGQSDHEAYIEY